METAVYIALIIAVIKVFKSILLVSIKPSKAKIIKEYDEMLLDKLALSSIIKAFFSKKKS